MTDVKRDAAAEPSTPGASGAAAPRAAASGERPFVAYALQGAAPVQIVRAPRTRPWIDAFPRRFTAQCLPLMVANQSGWWLLNATSFTVTWDGRDAPNALAIEGTGGGERPRAVVSRFGYGIVTFEVPYVFRTPPGTNLLVRGPTNVFKDGIAPIEGLVEADWAVATFAMHWKLTRVGHPVTFEAGEPFCMIVPQGRGELETLRPVIRRIEDDPELLRQYQAWSASRQQNSHMRHAAALVGGQQAVYDIPCELHYTRGTSPGGASAPPEHQTRRTLRDFTADE
jgi:Family of unknown function (DUF6065)